MGYVKDKLIARPGYGTSGPPAAVAMGDDVPWYQKLLGGLGTGFASGQQTQQATVAAETQAALAAQQGIGMGDVVLIGALGVGVFMLMKRKKG